MAISITQESAVLGKPGLEQTRLQMTPKRVQSINFFSRRNCHQRCVPASRPVGAPIDGETLLSMQSGFAFAPSHSSTDVLHKVNDGSKKNRTSEHGASKRCSFLLPVTSPVVDRLPTFLVHRFSSEFVIYSLSEIASLHYV